MSTPSSRVPASLIGARTIGFKSEPSDPTAPASREAVGRSPWQIFWREFRRSPLALESPQPQSGDVQAPTIQPSTTKPVIH